MKYLWLSLLILASCANRGVDDNAGENAKPRTGSSTSENLTLVEAYQKTTTGGKEREDGKHTSTAYSIVLLKGKDVIIEGVYLFGEGKDFEAVDYEGKHYIIIQVYPEAKDQVRGDMIQTADAASIFYKENNVKKYLGIPKFQVKEAVIGN